MAVPEDVDKVIQIARASRGDDRHFNRVGKGLCQADVVTGLGPVGIHAGEEEFAGRARLIHTHGLGAIVYQVKRRTELSAEIGALTFREAYGVKGLPVEKSAVGDGVLAG